MIDLWQFVAVCGITVYDRTRYLVLFSLEKYVGIHNRIIYLIRQKSGIIYVFLTITWKSKLILVILCPFKKYWFSIMS